MDTKTDRIHFLGTTVTVGGTLIIKGTDPNADVTAFNVLDPRFNEGDCVRVDGTLVAFRNVTALNMQTAAPDNSCP